VKRYFHTLKNKYKQFIFKKILNNGWIDNPNFQYAGFSGKAELYKGDRVILFKKKNEENISVVSIQAAGLCDKKLI